MKPKKHLFKGVKKMTLKKQKKGQAITEYLIITALIGIASIGIIQVLSSNLRGKLNVVSSALRGEKKSHQGKKADRKQTEILDLGDFQNSMTDSK